MKETLIRKGAIFYADLSPVVGSEQGGTRPVLIVSNDLGNKRSSTVIVAIITTINKKSCTALHYKLKDKNYLKKPSFVLLEQLRTIDKSRLLIYKSKVSKEELATIDKKLLVSLGICLKKTKKENEVKKCVKNENSQK